MSAPTTSIVMSVFNSERFLAEAIESILNQSLDDFEFIAIDDGSEDSSGSILESYRKKDSRLRVYHQENRGLVESLNRGCSIAQGRYIARMDADDVSVRERLRWQVEFMEAHPEIGLLGGAIEYVDADGRTLGICRHPVEDQAIRTALNRFEGSFCHPATVMRREVLAVVGEYRSAFLAAEDYDLWLRMAKFSRLANLNAVVLKYRIHSGQVSQQNLIQQGLSMLGANEIDSSTETAEWDALRSGAAITAAVLTSQGVSEARQQQVLIARFRDSICTLALTGQNSAALNRWEDMHRFSRWEYVEKSLIAHLWLIRASLCWRQGRIFDSLLAGVRALTIWPVVVGRPVKSLLARLSKRLAPSY